MKEAALRIGEVAGEAGVNIQTLRFYERRGLLKPPARRPSGYREYPRESVSRVRFIKRAQQLGFTLKEVEELLRLRDADSAPCNEARAAAEEKLAEIDRKLRQLKAMKRALEALVESCASSGKHHCPLLEALDESLPIVQLLGAPDCPNVEPARRRLREVLASEGLPAGFEEVDLSAADTPAALRAWGSPSILVDGQDIALPSAVAGAACRLYPGATLSGVPPEHLIRAAIKKAVAARRALEQPPRPVRR